MEGAEILRKFLQKNRPQGKKPMWSVFAVFYSIRLGIMNVTQHQHEPCREGRAMRCDLRMKPYKIKLEEMADRYFLLFLQQIPKETA